MNKYGLSRKDINKLLSTSKVCKEAKIKLYNYHEKLRKQMYDYYLLFEQLAELFSAEIRFSLGNIQNW